MRNGERLTSSRRCLHAARSLVSAGLCITHRPGPAAAAGGLSQYTQLRHHSPMSQQQTSAKGVSRIASLLMPVHPARLSSRTYLLPVESTRSVAARERCRGRAQAACAAERPPQKSLAPPWRLHPRLWHTTARQARDTVARSVRVAAVRAALLGEHDAHHHVHRVAGRRALLGLGRRCRDLGVPLGGRIRDRRGRRRADLLAPAIDVLAQSPKPLELGLRLGGGGEARLQRRWRWGEGGRRGCAEVTAREPAFLLWSSIDASSRQCALSWSYLALRLSPLFSWPPDCGAARESCSNASSSRAAEPSCSCSSCFAPPSSSCAALASDCSLHPRIAASSSSRNAPTAPMNASWASLANGASIL